MKILFVCSGNVARSQEAAAFYNELTESSDAQSAGTNAIIGKAIHPFVLQAMDEVGLDMAGTFRKALTLESIKKADLIVSFVPLDVIPASNFEGKQVLYWEVPDPRGGSIDVQRQTRDDVRHLVEGLIA
jgi:protein-tyrosine-phosphatase